MPRVIRGALAGAVATAVMTAPVELGRRLGLYRTPQPKDVTAGVVGHEPATPTWLAAHFAMGAGLGTLFAALPRHGRVAGLAFGLAVWATNYGGVLPATGIYLRPGRDRDARALVGVASHLVFGLAVAETYSRL
jgi:hypothetical protein